MSRRILVLLGGVAVAVLALDLLGVVPLGLLGRDDETTSHGDVSLLGASGEGDEHAATAAELRGRGRTADDAEADSGEVVPEAEPARVAGTTPGGAVVHGRVLSGAVPAAGVRVRLTRYDSLISYLRAEVNGRYDEVQATTGEDGRFTFVDVTPAKDYLVRAIGRPLGLAITSSDELDLRGRETVDVGDLVLGPGATLTGRVLDQAQQPAADVRVTATWRIANPLGVILSDPDLAPDLQAPAVITDADGRFRIEHLEAAPTTVFFNAPSGAAHVERSVALTEATTTLDDVVLPSNRFIAGGVSWSDGEPIAGVRVFASSMREGNVRAATTDAAGRFRLTWLPEGPLGLGVLVPGMPVHMERGVATGRDDVKVVFPVPGTLRGRVVREKDGEPVTRFRVQVRDQAALKDWTLRFVRAQVARGLGPTPFSSTKGIFAFPRTAPGTYTLVVSAEGHPPVTKADVTVVAKETTEVEIRVPQGHVARGRVLDAAGDGVANARLFVLADAVEEGATPEDLRQAIRNRQPDAVAEPNGTFALPPQTPGRYDVIADHPDGLPGVARAVRLDADSRADLEIVLPPTGGVKGRLGKEDGGAAAGEVVHVLYADGMWHHTETDDEGRFEAKALPVGRCLVRWFSLPELSRHGRALRGADEEQRRAAYDALRQDGGEREIVVGRMLDVRLRMPRRTAVTGTLLIDGRPPPERERIIWVSGEPGRGHFQLARADEEGRFSMRLVPGSYVVHHRAAGGTYRTTPFEVPPGDSFTLELPDR